jgi:hypothetical protein
MTIMEKARQIIANKIAAQQQAQTTGDADVYTPPYTPPYFPQTEQSTTTSQSVSGSMPWLWIVGILVLIFVYFKFIRK